MSKRLSDERLACVEAIGQWAREHDKAVELPHDDVQVMAAELRERRASDLTAEDAAFQRGRESVEHWKQYATPVLTAEEREALTWARRDLTSMHTPYRTSDHDQYLRALAVLDKLLASGGGK